MEPQRGRRANTWSMYKYVSQILLWSNQRMWGGNTHQISISHPERFKKWYSNHRSNCSTCVPRRDRPDRVVKVGIASINTELFSDGSTGRSYHRGIKANEHSDPAAQEELPPFLLRWPVERVLRVSLPSRVRFLFLNLVFHYGSRTVLASNLRTEIIKRHGIWIWRKLQDKNANWCDLKREEKLSICIAISDYKADMQDREISKDEGRQQIRNYRLASTVLCLFLRQISWRKKRDYSHNSGEAWMARPQEWRKGIARIANVCADLWYGYNLYVFYNFTAYKPNEWLSLGKYEDEVIGYPLLLDCEVLSGPAKLVN